MKPITMLVAAGLIAGCATVQIPAERLERSQAIIRSAEEVGAMSVPQAKLHLQLARDQIAAARQLAERGDERSLVLMSRAQADADLALALAREDAARRQTRAAQVDLQKLKSQGGTP
jgi:hypothetical protein